MIRNRTQQVDGINVFYREAGDPASPKLLLLGGFPASSHQFRNLIPALADHFHVLCPDYPGFGNSDMPEDFDYTFDRLSEIVTHIKRFHDEKVAGRARAAAVQPVASTR
jgi:pimeloyl-ACP methyl ester carboxylesterase